MRFETSKDIDRENEAIKKYINNNSIYDFTYKKLGENDIDFALLKDNKEVAFVEVKGRNRNIDNAFPLPIALRKVAKMQDKTQNAIIIWDCLDGIIYALTRDLVGQVRYGGRKPRQGSTNDQEIMIYYDKQDKFTILKNEQNRTQ